MLNTKITTMLDLAELVRQTRKKQGLTQSDLAGMSGLGRRFISELERGKPTAQISKVLLVFNVLGIRIEAKHEWEL
jgi:HTH-type transcriptional regulator/antitoxin HipB